jgi:hypothetical protein
VRPVRVAVAAVGAEHVLEVAASEDKDPVEAVGANCADPTLGEGVCVRRLARRVRITLMPSARKTSSKARLNLVSRSWMRNRNGCSSANCMAMLRACWVT